MINEIPFNKPGIVGKELEYIQQAIINMHLSGDGVFTKKCSSLLEVELCMKKALLTTSCTHALEMVAILLVIQTGDEVIVPSFTFVSTVNAFVLRGAKPVFIDIRPDTLNMDENQLEGLITEKTKAIIPVHYAGVGCEMDIIMNIAKMIQKELKDSFDYDCPIEIIKPSTDVTKVDSFIFSIKKIRQLGFSSEIVDKEFLSLLNYCKIKYHK